MNNKSMNTKYISKGKKGPLYGEGLNCRKDGQTCVCQPRKPIWNGINNIKEDRCTQRIDEMQSQLPGCYNTNNFFRWCESQQQYADLMTEPMQFYKPYFNACRVDTDSVLRYADLTNKGEIYNLYTAPYQTVPYMGAGTRSLSNKALESKLQQGHAATTYKPCEPTSGVTIDRFQCLPNFGNAYIPGPYGSHLIQAWTRGGEDTRNYIQRINYQKFCLNKLNNNIINRSN